MPAEETLVALRVENDFFRVFPYESPALVPFELEAAVRGFNIVIAVKLRSSSVLAAMAKVYAVPPR